MSKAKKSETSPEAEYLYSVEWSEKDAVHVGRVAEFPSLAAHGNSPRAALDEIMSVVRFVLKDLRDSSEDIPAPFSKRKYSGKLNLRMPQSLHRRLSIEASQQGVSLNQHINMKLEVGN